MPRRGLNETILHTSHRQTLGPKSGQKQVASESGSRALDLFGQPTRKTVSIFFVRKSAVGGRRDTPGRGTS